VIVVPNVGLLRLLNAMLGLYSPGALQVALFVGNYTPTHADTEATYTAMEATFAGYSRYTPSPWAAAYMVFNQATAYAAPRTWTVTASGGTDIVYGYFVLDAAGGLLWVSLEAQGPLPMRNAGDSYTCTPGLAYASQN